MSDRPQTQAQSLIPIGRSGVVQYGGRLYHDDVERAWRGSERDKTIIRMQNDPVIGAIMHGVEMMIRGVTWDVEAATGKGINEQAAKDAATFIDECLDDMDGFWPGEPMSAILSYIGWGWVLLEQIYKVRGGPDAAETSHRSKYDDGRIGWRKWSNRPQATREGWVFDEVGDPTVLIQRDPQGGPLLNIPLDRCIHITYSSKTNSPEGWTPLRSCFKSWYYKNNIEPIEAIGIERDLAGVPVIRIPLASIEARDDVYDWAVGAVTGIKNDDQAGLVLGSDRDENGNLYQDFSLVSTGGQRAFDTDKIIRRYANEIVTVFLANVMRTGQDGIGALALSETQSGLFQQAISAHLDIIGDAINTQAIPQLLRLNGIDQELAPKIVHGKLEKEDLQAFGNYLVSLSTAGILEPTPEMIEFAYKLGGLPIANMPTQQDLDAKQAAKAEQAKQIAGVQQQPTEPAPEENAA
jgi:hypothetical protein